MDASKLVTGPIASKIKRTKRFIIHYPNTSKQHQASQRAREYSRDKSPTANADYAIALHRPPGRFLSSGGFNGDCVNCSPRWSMTTVPCAMAPSGCAHGRKPVTAIYPMGSTASSQGFGSGQPRDCKPVLGLDALLAPIVTRWAGSQVPRTPYSPYSFRNDATHSQPFITPYGRNPALYVLGQILYPPSRRISVYQIHLPFRSAMI